MPTGFFVVFRRARVARAGGAALLTLALLLPLLALAAACAAPPAPLEVGFYAYFEPVSYSAGDSPEAAGFNSHRGYEADLLTALEAMEGSGFVFNRRAIPEWSDIWLRPAGDEFDIVGGGITILEARTKDHEGNTAVAFTNGHIAFRQSLLVRSADLQRLATHADLTGETRVGALPDTTGEARLLQLTGLADESGVLRAGVRVVVAGGGEVTADGTPAYYITASEAAASLAGRRHIYPPDDTMPQVVYLGEEQGEGELLAALRNGTIDAIARGEIGNTDAAHQSEGAFVVTALDSAVEYGGFAVAAGDEELRKKLNQHLRWLTNNRRIGYAEWRANPEVFLKRAEAWEP